MINYLKKLKLKYHLKQVMRPEKQVDLINRSLLHIYAVCTRSGRSAGGSRRSYRSHPNASATHTPPALGLFGV